MFRIFRLTIAVSILLLSASAGFGPSTASPPTSAPDVSKPSPRAATNLTPSPSSSSKHAHSGLIGVNKQTVYSSSASTFAQARRVLRTERSNAFRDGASMLWDKDRSDEQQQLQRRTKQRAKYQQQRLRLRKQILKASPSPSLPSPL